MTIKKKRILINSFFDSEFNYCPLINSDKGTSEMYKVKINLSPKAFSDKQKFCQTEINPYNLRIHNNFVVSSARSLYHGSVSISCLGPKRWDILPELIKEANSWNSFKKFIKKWVPQTCICTLWKLSWDWFLLKTYNNKCI